MKIAGNKMEQELLFDDLMYTPELSSLSSSSAATDGKVSRLRRIQKLIKMLRLNARIESLEIAASYFTTQKMEEVLLLGISIHVL